MTPRCPPADRAPATGVAIPGAVLAAVLVAVPGAALLAGCVLGPAQVALSLGSSVASRIIVDEYVKPVLLDADAGTAPARPDGAQASAQTGAQAGGVSLDFSACLDGYLEEQAAAARLDRLAWCRAGELTHEERTRVLVAEATVALEAGDVARFREAAGLLGPGSLEVAHAGDAVDLVAVVKGLSAGRSGRDMPAGLQRMLDAGSP